MDKRQVAEAQEKIDAMRVALLVLRDKYRIVDGYVMIPEEQWEYLLRADQNILDAMENLVHMQGLIG